MKKNLQGRAYLYAQPKYNPPHQVLSNRGFQEEQRQEFQIFVNCSFFYPNKKYFPTPKCLFKISILNKPDLVA